MCGRITNGCSPLASRLSTYICKQNKQRERLCTRKSVSEHSKAFFGYHCLDLTVIELSIGKSSHTETNIRAVNNCCVLTIPFVPRRHKDVLFKYKQCFTDDCCKERRVLCYIDCSRQFYTNELTAANSKTCSAQQQASQHYHLVCTLETSHTDLLQAQETHCIIRFFDLCQMRQKEA